MKCFSTFLLITVLLTGCEVFTNKPESVVGMNVSDALYLGVNEAINTTDPESNNLVKIMTGDSLGVSNPVEFTDGEGNFLGQNVIYADTWGIHPASEDFSIIAGEFKFDIRGGEQRHFGLVLNNKTGAIYGLEDYYYPEPLYGLQGQFYYQTDEEGNIYYVKSNLYRILVNDGTNLQLEKYMDAAGGIFDQRYLVDRMGNVYFQNGGRVKKVSGGIEDTGMNIVAFNGSDGNCYGFQQTWVSSENGNIQEKVNTLKLEIIDGSFKATEINEKGFYFEGGVSNSYQYFDPQNNRSIFITQGYFNPEITRVSHWPVGFIFDETTYDIIPVVINEDKYFEIMGLSGDFLWVKLDDNIYEAWNLSNLIQGNISTIEDIRVFEIPDNFNVTSARMIRCGDGISITAFNLETETNYIGKIDASDGFEYYEIKNESVITNLTKIN